MGARATLKYHYFDRFFTYSVKRRAGREPLVSGLETRTVGVKEGSRVRRLRSAPSGREVWREGGGGGAALAGDPLRRQRQAGSLTGAVHLSKGNAGVLR